MGVDTEISCRCGKVKGRLQDVSPHTVNRVVCYCDDCQAYLSHLKRPDLLDAQGGTDIVQVAPAALSFQSGAEYITGLRLTAKGLYRWYAGCCQTPIGNTAGPFLPFVGIEAHTFLGGKGKVDALVGKPAGAVFGKFAIGQPPPGSTGLNLRFLARTVGLVLGWRLRGKTWPHPFFDHATRAPTRPVTTLSRPERERLRSGLAPAAK